MLGESDQISLDQLAEVARRKPLFDRVQVLPRFGLAGLRPNLPVHRVREKVRTRQLRIFRIPVSPVAKRLFGEIHLRDDVRVGRVCAGADRFVAERVVDPQIAHLEPSEVLVAGSGYSQHVELMLPEFRNRRLLGPFRGRLRRRFRRWCRCYGTKNAGCRGGSQKRYGGGAPFHHPASSPTSVRFPPRSGRRCKTAKYDSA